MSNQKLKTFKEKLPNIIMDGICFGFCVGFLLSIFVIILKIIF